VVLVLILVTVVVIVVVARKRSKKEPVARYILCVCFMEKRGHLEYHFEAHTEKNTVEFEPSE